MSYCRHYWNQIYLEEFLRNNATVFLLFAIRETYLITKNLKNFYIFRFKLLVLKDFLLAKYPIIDSLLIFLYD